MAQRQVTATTSEIDVSGVIGAGHNLHEDAPAAVNAQISAFLDC